MLKRKPRLISIEGKFGTTTVKNVNHITQPVKNTSRIMKEPKVIEMFADNGEHSHWQLVNEAGEVIWSEEPSEITPSANSENWIPLSEQKPEPHTMVLAKIDRGEGKTWVILARFIPARTVLAEDFFEDFFEDDMDYDEENDQYYVPETWVECSYFGSDLMFHSEPVIEWKPI